MVVGSKSPDPLGVQLNRLRDNLRKQGWRSKDDEALLAELDALSNTAWLVTPLESLHADAETPGMKVLLEIRVKSGDGGPVAIDCSNLTCPHKRR